MIGLRLAYMPELRRLVNETLHRKGLEQSELIESLRGIGSIKLYQKEPEREAIWNNQFTGFLNTASSLQMTQANYLVVKDLVINCSIVLLIYTGIKFVLDVENDFTLGAFVAFAAYREMFFQRLNSFLDQLIEFSMSRVHLERLGEILSEDQEYVPTDFHRIAENELKIELRNVSYQFAAEQEMVLKHLDLTLHRGDRITLFGQSGSGKTTLLKLMAGVYLPSEGQIFLNDVNVAGAGLKFLRSQAAMVLQGDYLFKGSLLDNITFFDRLPDADLAMQCAKLACIDDVIRRMPMSYETLIGEMGTSLSQGEQQRVLLARALYQKKPLLVLDEGTAHLDEQTEQLVLENLRKLNITILMTAHKRALGSFGTRIWEITEEGRIVMPSVSDQHLPNEGRFLGTGAPI